MELTSETLIKYSFSGHDSFQCRQFWLKKGFDHASNERSFNKEIAVIGLGVGKNMVDSIRFWLKAFNVTDNRDAPTAFGISLLADNGFDPFLEDDGSLWLLHYYLVKANIASIYFMIFNEFRREKVEFNRETFVNFVRRKAETNKAISFNPKTVADDFDVFRKMYLTNSLDKGSEDGYSGLLADLDLVKKIEVKEGNKKEEAYVIENATREKLPVEIFLYSILENKAWGDSISLNSLESDMNSPGSIFAINRLGLIEKIKEAQGCFDWVSFNDQAGIKELQLKENKLKPERLLEIYYGQQ